MRVHDARVVALAVLELEAPCAGLASLIVFAASRNLSMVHSPLAASGQRILEARFVEQILVVEEHERRGGERNAPDLCRPSATDPSRAAEKSAKS